MSERNWAFRIRGEGSEDVEIDIYDVIGEGFFWRGVTAKDIRGRLKRNPGAKRIKLRVNSAGGDVFDGFTIYQLLVDHPARVEAEVDALAASMASVILMAADEIRVAVGAMIMVHNPWALAIGDADEMRARAELLEKIGGQIADAYHARTGLPRDQLLQMMADETWLPAQEAVELGFADTLKEAKTKSRMAAFAAVDLDGLRNVPEGVQRFVAQAREEMPRQVVVPDGTAVAGPRLVRPTTENHPADPGGAPKAQKAEEPRKMENIDLKTLRAQHRDLYDEIVAIGVDQGAKDERDRVLAHLEMGEASGDLKTAFAAIREGKAMTQQLSAKYLAASMNRADRKTRQAETDEAGEAIAGADKTTVVSDVSEASLRKMEEARGIKSAGERA